jgi:UDP-N-acetylglucosamine/UDP-N-acetylgalactosamine diphosphorylase
MLTEELYNKLETYGQLHLLKHWNELSKQQQEQLLLQISLIDFSLLNLLPKKSIYTEQNSSSRRGIFSPIATLTLSEINCNKNIFYTQGIQAIREGKTGAVLLAGGQGTRLGFELPKGMYNIGITKELYLFEQLIYNLFEVVKQADAWIPLFIMTSRNTYDIIIEFFKRHAYFGYHPDYIAFFPQEMAPSVDYNGKIYMEDAATISLSPNGNGGWFHSLVNAGLLDKIMTDGVEWLNVFSVDNVLQKIADPYYIGATILSGCACGSKVVKKATPEEKVGAICLEDGKPSIVEYFEMTDEMRYARDDQGELLYNYGVILNYLFKVTALEKINNNTLPIHVVEKKIPYLNEHGNYINPTEPNGYKFETLVLDLVHMLNSCLPYEVERSKEFAPIKNKTGVDSLDTARELMRLNGIII